MRSFFIIYHSTLGVFKGNSWLPDVENFVIKSKPIDTYNPHAGHYASLEMAREVALRFAGFPDPKRIHELKHPPRITHDQLLMMAQSDVYRIEIDGDHKNRSLAGHALEFTPEELKVIYARLASVDDFFGYDSDELQEQLNKIIKPAGRTV